MFKIKNKQYETFVKEQLPRFKKYFREGTVASKKELKRALYENKNLSERQKDELWRQITAK